MKLYKRLLLLMTAVALVFVFGIGSAFASASSPSVDELSFLGTLDVDYEVYTGSLSSSFLWDVYGLGWETTRDDCVIYFNETETIFQIGDAVGTGKEDVDLTSAYFVGNMGTTTNQYLSSSQVVIYEILNPSTFGSLNLDVGDLVIGFNNNPSFDCDFDDLVVLAKPTPIPGALWLLGSGLLGLIGFRRNVM